MAAVNTYTIGIFMSTGSAIASYTELDHSLNAEAFCPTVLAMEQARQKQQAEGKTSFMDGWFARVLRGCKNYSRKHQSPQAASDGIASDVGNIFGSGSADFDSGSSMGFGASSEESNNGDDAFLLQDPWAKK